MSAAENSGESGSIFAFAGVMRRLWPDIRRQWRLLVLGFLALLAETALRLLEPWPLKVIIDRVVDVEAPNPSWLGDLSPETVLLVMAFAIVGTTAVRAGASYLTTVAFAVAATRITASIRTRLFRHLHRLSLAFHHGARGGDLTTRLVSDTSRLQDVSVTAIVPMVSNAATLVGMVAVMTWLDWRLTLAALVVFPAFVLTTTRFSGAIQGAARGQREREGAMASTAAESLTAIKVVQSLSLESRMDGEFETQNEAGAKTAVRGKRLEASLERSVDVLVAIGTAVVLWLGGRLVLSGEISPGELIVFSSYLKSGFRPVRDMAKYSSRIARATASGERITGILSTRPAVQDRPWARDPGRFKGRVAFENVTFSYQAGSPTLRDVSFTIEPGEQVAVVGPSGSGKSTLTSLLLRLYDPERGRVTIDGVDIRDMKLASLRSQMGVVLQDSLLFAVSARENIALGAEGVSAAHVEAAAKVANADDFIRALPSGYDTVLGERGATLSGGQRQRIAIARAVVRNAPIVLLDEPTTGLDGANRTEVMTALRALCAGRTTLMVVHDMELAAAADRVFVVDRGSLREVYPRRRSPVTPAPVARSGEMPAGGRHAPAF